MIRKVRGRFAGVAGSIEVEAGQRRSGRRVGAPRRSTPTNRSATRT
jgi:hypothetical protein